MNESELEEIQHLIDALSAVIDQAQKILDKDRPPPTEEVEEAE